MDSTSSFSKVRQPFPDAELLKVGGSTCECYRVRLYGKLHFLKRLKPELRTNPQYVAAMEKEFLMGYQLDHPHLVRYAARTDDGIIPTIFKNMKTQTDSYTSCSASSTIYTAIRLSTSTSSPETSSSPALDMM